MAAGLGEGTAIIAVLQVGFSLAKALNTYISDVSDAADDISSLVSDIEATFGQLEDLGELIKKNEKTQAWSKNGLQNAQKCVTDCEKIIKKLRKLLHKSTASAGDDNVTRDEIDVSKLEKARWPIYKPQLEVRRKELQSVKQDIVLAYSSYMTQIGPTVERQKFEDDIPRLQRARAIARKQVREAKEKRSFARQSKSKRPRLAQVSARGVRSVAFDDDDSNDGRDSFVELSVDGDGPFIYNRFDDLERDFEAWKAEEDARKGEEEAETKRIQEEAVDAWKRQQLIQAEALRNKVEDNRAALRKELTKKKLPPEQIDDIVNHVHPQDQVNAELGLFTGTPASVESPSVVSSNNPAASTHSRRWSFWAKSNSNMGQTFSSAATVVGETNATPIPEILQDPTAEGGIAPLEASYFQQIDGEVEQYDVEIPNRWLLDALIKRQEAIAQKSREVNVVWKEFSQLPDNYRHEIGSYMDRKKSSGKWVLLHLDCMFAKHRYDIFSRGRREQIVGVYVVLKRTRKQRARSPEHKSDKSSSDSNYGKPIVINTPARRQSLSMSHRPRAKSYLPRHHSRDSTFISRERSRSHNQTRDFDYGGNGVSHIDHERGGIRMANREYVEEQTYGQPTREYEEEQTVRRPIQEYEEVEIVRRPNRVFEEEPTYRRPPRASNRSPERIEIESPIRPRRSSLHDHNRDDYVPYLRPRKVGRSHSRSPSPRPLRRSGTDESYRSSGSARNPAPIRHRRGRYDDDAGLVSEIVIRRDRLDDSRLSDIYEASEDSSVSSSSDNNDDAGLPGKRRLPLEQTDQQLLEKTLNEYVNSKSRQAKVEDYHDDRPGSNTSDVDVEEVD